MTLTDFMVQEKLCCNAAEVQAYARYERISINGNIARSPWRELHGGDVLVLRKYDIEGRCEGNVNVVTYKDEKHGTC